MRPKNIPKDRISIDVAIEMFEKELKTEDTQMDKDYTIGCEQVIAWLSELKGYRQKIKEKTFVNVPKKEGFIIHDGSNGKHMDKVELEFIEMQGCQPVYVFSGTCGDDGMTFGIDVEEEDIEKTILTEEAAEEFLYGK